MLAFAAGPDSDLDCAAQLRICAAGQRGHEPHVHLCRQDFQLFQFYPCRNHIFYSLEIGSVFREGVLGLV